MIMKGRTSLQLPGVGLCCLVLVGAATLPAWASASQTAPAPPARVDIQTPPAPPQPPARVPAPKVLAPKDDVVVYAPRFQKVPPPPAAVKTLPRGTYTVHLRGEASLPEDGKALLEKYQADSKAIQDEINMKLDARRALAVKELEALQEKYTKEGKLDEAVAIRDYLRAGGPGSAGLVRYTLSKSVR